MSRMLTFYDAAWASARDCAAAGRRADALAFLAPLLSSADVPRLVRLAHRLAGRLRTPPPQDYRMARKHLLAAASSTRTPPRSSTSSGWPSRTTLTAATGGPPAGSARPCARPEEARYAAALGRALVRMNRVRAGVHLADDRRDWGGPADPAVLAVVADGLCDAGRPRLRAEVVAKARFLAPADRAIHKLWDDVNYAEAAAAVSGLPPPSGGGRRCCRSCGWYATTGRRAAA